MKNTIHSLMMAMLAMFVFHACCSHPVEEEDTPTQKIYFTGIFPVDDAGQSLSGDSDSTDWTWKTSYPWADQEKNLFPATSASPCYIDSLIVYPVTPNPISNALYNGRCFLPLYNQTGVVWRLRLVNEQFEVVQTFDLDNLTAGFNMIGFELATLPNDTFRLYYQAERLGCYQRGFGDLLITP